MRGAAGSERRAGRIGCGTVLLVGIGAFLTAVAVLIIVGPVGFDQEAQPWRGAAIEHPKGTPAVAFEQRQIHPLQAEYDYRVRFGSGPDAVVRWLPLNVGGRTEVNAYWYPASEGGGPTSRLQDHWGESLLRLDEMRTELVIAVRGHVFAGEILERDAGAGWSRRRGPDDAVRLTGMVEGRPAPEISDTAVGLGRGRYLGRIEQRRGALQFVPASASPEQEVEMVGGKRPAWERRERYPAALRPEAR